MAEYIEREAAERILESVGAPAYAIHALTLAKTTDVAPVVHGRWVFDHTYTGKHKEIYVCSVCNHYQSTRKHHEPSRDPMYMKYCPNCGARMDL